MEIFLLFARISKQEEFIENSSNLEVLPFLRWYWKVLEDQAKNLNEKSVCAKFLNLFSLKRKFVQIKIVGKSFYLSKYLKVFSQDGKIARRQSMHGETRIVVK